MFAAAMIVIALYCAGRLALSRLWQRETEVDADGIHVLMGVAMAGMLVPRLNLLPRSAWEAVFGVAAAWFAWQATRGRYGSTRGSWRCPYPVPHLVECAAMLYMLLAVSSSRPGGAGSGMPMPGMGAAGSLPALAVVLALFMLGYVIWTTDRLTTLTRARTAAPARSAAWGHARIPVTPGGMAVATPQDAAGTSGTAGTWRGHPAGSLMLAPRLAASYKIAMSIAMGYMLIQML